MQFWFKNIETQVHMFKNEDEGSKHFKKNFNMWLNHLMLPEKEFMFSIEIPVTHLNVDLHNANLYQTSLN